MKKSLIHDDNYLRAVIDALPTAVFIVEKGFNIIDSNPSAKKLFGIDSDVILSRLCGEIMHCMIAIESKSGCGATEYCSDCVIRNSVELAFKGKKTHQKKYKMTIQENGVMSNVHMLITTSPFIYKDGNFVLLAVEDITEITTLKRLIPICTSCKKIRNDENYWEAVADYLNKHADLEFTHSICPECAHKLYPDLEL